MARILLSCARCRVGAFLLEELRAMSIFWSIVRPGMRIDEQIRGNGEQRQRNQQQRELPELRKTRMTASVRPWPPCLLWTIAPSARHAGRRSIAGPMIVI